MVRLALSLNAWPWVRVVVRARTSRRVQYALDCGGSAASAASCVELKESMDRATGDIQLFLHLPMVIYVQGKIAFTWRSFVKIFDDQPPTSVLNCSPQ